MPIIAALPSIIGAGSSIVGGILGGRASSRAGSTQAQGNERAADDILAAVREVNPQLADAMEQAIAGVQASSDAAATGVEGATAGAQTGATTAAQQANELLAPFLQAGTGALPGLQDTVNQRFDFSADPGYDFRLQEGIKALERSSAARGTLAGGRTLKELTRYGQEFGSNEYSRAFDRFMEQQRLRTSTLSNLVGLGFDAGGRSGTNLTQAAQYSGDIGVRGATTAGGFRVGASEFAGNARMSTADRMARNELDARTQAGELRTGAAAARAAGTVGRANAITGAITGAGRAGAGYFTLRELLQPPRARPSQPNLGAYGATGEY